MSFAPLLPATGVAGFRLLAATEATQRAVFERQPEITRDVDYFLQNIGDVRSAEDLVADRRLMRVALGAFGLDEEIDKSAFMRKILEEGSENSDSFANRLVDPRFKRMARAFGFGDFLGARTSDVGFAAGIAAAYQERQFEIAVGQQNESLRLALNFRREIQVHARSADPAGAAWFSAMGDLPVRQVLEGALGFPSGASQLDIDRQRDEFRDLNSKTFGSKSLAVFDDPENIDKAITRFLARRSIEEGPSSNTPGFAALTLLTSHTTGLGAVGLQNVVLSGG
ncbi:MAG: DUF1217 domain-containing protein [Pikeienuella sp.]